MIITRIDDVQRKLLLTKSYIVCPVEDCQREVADSGALRANLEIGCLRILGSHCRPSVKIDNSTKWLSSEEIRKARDEIESAGLEVDSIH